MRSGNPALNSGTFDQWQGQSLQQVKTDTYGQIDARGGLMTLDGTVAKSFLLMVILLASAAFTWNQYYSAQNPAAVMGLLIAGAVGGLIVAMITIFKRQWSPVTSPIYALLEGLVLGGLSSVLEAQYPGVVIQAVSLTMGIMLALLAAYATHLIKVSENFKLGVVAATGGVCIVYVVDLLLGMFGIHVPFIHDSGPIGIGISAVIVVIASLNLVMDFDFIEQGTKSGAPKYMEWYSAFGLMVTLVWLYLEILNLLAKMRRR